MLYCGANLVRFHGTTQRLPELDSPFGVTIRTGNEGFGQGLVLEYRIRRPSARDKAAVPCAFSGMMQR